MFFTSARILQYWLQMGAQDLFKKKDKVHTIEYDTSMYLKYIECVFSTWFSRVP